MTMLIVAFRNFKNVPKKSGNSVYWDMYFTQAIFSLPAYFGNTSHTAMKQKYVKGLRKSKNFMTKEDFSGKRISLCTNSLGFGHTEREGSRGGQRSVPAAGRRSNCIMYDCTFLVKQKAGWRGGPVEIAADSGHFVFWGQIFQAGSTEWRKN